MLEQRLQPLFALVLFAACSAEEGMGPSEPGGSVAGKADGIGLDPFECGFANEGDGRIEDLELEVLGATLTPADDGYDLALEMRDLRTEETEVLELPAATQNFAPTLSVTKLSASWEVQAEESPFFDVSISLGSVDGKTYNDDDDGLGLRLEFSGVPLVCERSPSAEQTPNDKLTAHVAANFAEVAAAGAAQLGIDVDDIDVQLSTLQCLAVPGHTLQGTDDVTAGTCTIRGVSVVFAINVADEEDGIGYTMTPIACEDGNCPGDDSDDSEECCRTCVTSQACGDSCISAGATCSQDPGCACQG